MVFDESASNQCNNGAWPEFVAAPEFAYTTQMIRPLDELLTLIASGMTTEEVANFQASPTAKSVLESLIHRQKTTGLSAEEIAELESFLQLEQIMQLAKAKARVLLGK